MGVREAEEILGWVGGVGLLDICGGGGRDFGFQNLGLGTGEVVGSEEWREEFLISDF